MKKKLVPLAAVLGMTILATWAPRAEAIGYCSSTYCAGKTSDTACACPPGTDRVGQPSNCIAYTTRCWYF